MKKNDLLHTPRRQSYVALFYIVWKSYKALFRQLLPLLVAIGLGSSTNSLGKIFWVALTATILSMCYSLLAFFKFKFYIDGQELIIEKGIFTKKRISIDLERIQVINLEQNFIHRLFDVTKLVADTAGSSKEEFALDAIDLPTAYALKDLISDFKPTTTDAITSHTSTKAITRDSILNLTPLQLIKAGLVENHLKSSWAIFGFIAYIYFNLQEIGINVEDYTEEYSWQQANVKLIALITLAMGCLSILISLFKMIFNYYNLEVIKTDLGIQYTAGLITRKMVTAQYSKLQTMSWSNNKLKRFLGIYDVKLKQASAEEVENKKQIHIPAMEWPQIETVLNTAFPRFDQDNIHLYGINKKWISRQWLFRPIVPIVLCIVGFFFNKLLMPLGFGLGILLMMQAYLRFKKAAFGLDYNYIFIKGGIFGDQFTVLPVEKVQGIKEKCSPYMRRHQLVTMQIFHAAGSIDIPYVNQSQARLLSNYLLYRVEDNEVSFM